MRCELPQVKDDGWRLSDDLWGHIRLLLPPPKPHPWGMHNPRVDDRSAMDAILFVLRAKRSLLTEASGIPIGLAIDGANRHDMKLVKAKAIKDEAGFRARRWVVERAHSWMNRFRGALIRWAKRVDTYLAMLHFACALITWKKVVHGRN